MKKSVIAILTVLAAVGCSQNTAKYVIRGAAPEDGAVVRLVDKISSEPIDSAVVTDGTFKMKGKTDKDALLSITLDGTRYSFPFFNDGTPVQASFVDSTFTGSELNGRVAEYSKKVNDAYKEYAGFQKYFAALPKEERDARYNEYSAAVRKYVDQYLAVFDENQDNLVPVAFIGDYRSMAGQKKYDELMASEASYLSHPFVVEVNRRIEEAAAKRKETEERKAAIVGQKFLDLEEADPDGNLHKLSEYAGKGNWVLVDFWASWCGPCKREMPNVVAAYKKYHKKGFDIVGLSFDDEKEDWIKALTEWGMPWTHLSDLKGWKTVASDVYTVNAIPDNILIDPEGTIVARDLRGPALEEKLAEIFK